MRMLAGSGGAAAWCAASPGVPAKRLAACFPAYHVFAESVTDISVAKMMRFSRGTDVTAGLRGALSGKEHFAAIPDDEVAN